MRILLDARFMDNSSTTSSVYARAFIENLAAVDTHNEYLVVVRPNQQRERLALGPNFEMVSYRPHPLSFRSLLGFHRLLNDVHADLVHFLSPIVPLFYRGPSVVTIHDLRALSETEESRHQPFLARSARRLFVKMIYPAAFRRSLWILCSSSMVRHDLLRTFPQLAAKLIVVLPGLSPDAALEIPAPQIEAIRAKCEITKPYLFSSVPGHPTRSLVPLVRAFANAVSDVSSGLPDCQLVISAAGDNSLRDVRRAVAASRIGDRIMLLEGLEREEERALLAGALAYVFPARQEGAGLSLLEAMAQGIPIVAAGDGALPEICGQAALYVDPDNVSEFAKGLIRCASDDELRARQAQAGRELARKRDWTESTRFVREIYQDLF
jgi:glycosyltransferase involved in cell wall biosynthesis